MVIPLILGGLALLYFAQKKKPAAQASTITGKTGVPYAVALNRQGTAGGVTTSVYDVFLLPNGTPIMEYAVTQAGSNPPSKAQFLSSPMAATNPILITAKADFL